jgi:iron complex transport system substrate-binding protein
MVSSTDSFGHVVKLKGPAQRIVSLAPSNTEIVFAVGAGAQLAGRDDFSDYPAEAAPVPSIGSLYPQANAEAIVALKPDLILAAGITSPDEIKKLEGLGLTIYVTSFANTLDDIYGDIRAIGALTGHAPEAEALVATMQTRAQAVTERVKDAEKPVVFYEIDATDPAKPWTAGPGSFIDQLLTLAGGVNAGGLASDPYPQLSLEQIAHQDPAVIILGSATFGGQTPELVAQRPGWGELSAVKNNRVFAFDDNLVSRPGPRVVDGLEALAKLIHPELFK